MALDFLLVKKLEQKASITSIQIIITYTKTSIYN